MVSCKLAVLAAWASSAVAATTTRHAQPACRVLPTDPDWPSVREWDALNATVGGRLIRGLPVAHVCYGPQADAKACSELRDSWRLFDPFLDQPVNVMSEYFANKTCTPFVPPADANDTRLCQLGNMASYAINVSDWRTAAAGVRFARDKNVRLVVKNTGHDLLGGSQGRGSLALWTHHLKDVDILEQYSSEHYTGPAVKIGAGVLFQDLYPLAGAAGLRVVGGSCPTIGANGGWRQGGGHGPLGSAYGLGADNTLEFEVVTTDGRHLTASPGENADLYWALSGGGAGNWAVVLSAIVKAHRDGPVTGSRLTVENKDGGEEAYWTLVEEWMRHLLVLETIPGFASEVLLSRQSFSLVIATLPGADDVAAMTGALAPLYDTLVRLKMTPVVNETKVQSSFLDHYREYLSGVVYTRNVTMGSRLIPRSLVRDPSRLPSLTATLRDVLAHSNASVILLGYNVSNRAHGIPPGFNAVTPAWRDSLFLIQLVLAGGDNDDWAKMSQDMSTVSEWQDRLRQLTPGGGGYINEATIDNSHFKQDYFGGTYRRLRAIKARYDPGFVLYSPLGVGSDEYAQRSDGHFCKV